MANGHKYEDPMPVTPVAKISATVISAGDLIYLDAGASNVPKPAGDFTWDTDLATTQESFIDAFLGVALDTAIAGQTPRIRVGTRGVYEFDCASASFAVGAYVGPAKQSGNLLEPQKVAAVATADLAIGRVVEATSSATKVKVRIFSALMEGGVQAIP